MRSDLFRKLAPIGAGISLLWAAGFAHAEPSHGIAMFGEPALPADFTHLPYVNPDAPKGGRIVLGESGTFNSFNPHVRKGKVPWMLRFYGYESLMGRNWDEPFSLYGLLAETIETGPNREWVEFTLRPEAKFSDGSPVTVEDVLWSYETLGTIGHGRYRSAWSKVETAEATGPRSVRFTFNTDDQELALIMGLRPILKKAQWEGKDFEAGNLDVIPIASAPYVIGDFKPGDYLTLVRNPDYWGKDLPFMQGKANLDEIRMETYLDGSVMFEAFRAGALTSYRDGDPAHWDAAYDFPAVRNGEVVQSVIPHQRPTGIKGFVMNTRRAPFDDWRVRQAFIELFNYTSINATVHGGALPRISSYFANSPLAMEPGAATGDVLALLEPYKAHLLPGAIEGYVVPDGDGTPQNRAAHRRALALLAEAGWEIKDNVMQNAQGDPLRFEILLKIGASENERIAVTYEQALAKLGINVRYEKVEPAVIAERTKAFDFDMAYYFRGLSLSPGNELSNYWGSEAADTPGSRNWMGVQSPAVDGLIDAMLASETGAEYRAAVRALDRVMISGRYVIPFGYSNVARIAHSSDLKYPDYIPAYGDWIMYQPDVWWSEGEMK